MTFDDVALDEFPLGVIGVLTEVLRVVAVPPAVLAAQQIDELTDRVLFP